MVDLPEAIPPVNPMTLTNLHFGKRIEYEMILGSQRIRLYDCGTPNINWLS